MFVNKITKAFLDALYIFLDGLVQLASDESPIVTGKISARSAGTVTGGNRLESLDLTDAVCVISGLVIRGTDNKLR
jgi:exocyst complex component 2